MQKTITGNTVALTFDNWSEFVESAADQKRIVWRRAKDLDDGTSWHIDRENWTGVRTMPDALRLAREGWPEGASALRRALDALTITPTLRRAPAMAYDVGGERPDVPLFVAGDPAHMITSAPVEERATRIYSFLIHTGARVVTKTHEIMNRGAALLRWIDALEQAGHRVEITALKRQRDDAGRGQILTGEFPLKKAGEHWEPDRLAFALAHPAAHRRLWFAHMEQTPEIEAGFSNAHGGSIDLKPEERPSGVIYLPVIQPGDHEWSTPHAALEYIRRIIEQTTEDRLLLDEEPASPTPAPTPAPSPPPAPTPAPAPTPRPRDMPSRFPGKCHGCGARFERGALITYDKAVKRVTACPSCRK